MLRKFSTRLCLADVAFLLGIWSAVYESIMSGRLPPLPFPLLVFVSISRFLKLMNYQYLINRVDISIDLCLGFPQCRPPDKDCTAMQGKP